MQKQVRPLSDNIRASSAVSVDLPYRPRRTEKSFARRSAVARRGLKDNRVITGVALDGSWWLFNA
ncbi:MAG: hypothetical protein WC856_16230 [Methylococcaceae bacterium]